VLLPRREESLKEQPADAPLPEKSTLENRIAQLEEELASRRKAYDALGAEKEQSELFIDSMLDHAFIAFDPEGRVLRWNQGAELVLGWRADEVLGQSAAVLYTPDDVAQDLPAREREEASEQGYVHTEAWHIRRGGTRFWCSGSLTAVRNQTGQLVGFVKILHDSTEWEAAQERLRESEERLRLFISNVTDYALLQVDTEAHISSWNAGAARAFGYGEDEILGQLMRTLYVPEDAMRGDAEADLEMARQSGRFEDARWLVRKDGSRFFARWVTTPMRDEAGKLRGYAKVMRDETERRNTEQQMRASLAEKRVLLREIHHRVKNNLQVVTSLLSIQADRLEKPELSAILADTENRVRAIAALHETLYSSQDLASIDFGSYVQHLVRSLIGFFGVDMDRLHVHVHTEDLVLDIGQAIPLGLILNELVTNAFKHAFPGGRSGTLEIQLSYVRDSVDLEKGQTLDEGMGKLTIKDDGVGLPEKLDIDEPGSMGLHLVNVLVAQLQGELELSRTRGTSISIKFPIEGILARFSEHGPDIAR
jgi:PAS domain S-box-containing protein